MFMKNLPKLFTLLHFCRKTMNGALWVDRYCCSPSPSPGSLVWGPGLHWGSWLYLSGEGHVGPLSTLQTSGWTTRPDAPCLIFLKTNLCSELLSACAEPTVSISFFCPSSLVPGFLLTPEAVFATHHLPHGAMSRSDVCDNTCHTPFGIHVGQGFVSTGLQVPPGQEPVLPSLQLRRCVLDHPSSPQGLDE